jgi:hypothetical protein
MDLLTSSIIDKVQEEGSTTRSAVATIEGRLAQLIGESEQKQKEIIKKSINELVGITQKQKNELSQEILQVFVKIQTPEQIDQLIQFIEIKLATLSKNQPASSQATEPPTAEARVVAEALPPPEDPIIKKARKFMSREYKSLEELASEPVVDKETYISYINKILDSPMNNLLFPDKPNKTERLKELMGKNTLNKSVVNTEELKRATEELNRRMRGVAYGTTDLQTATDQVGRTIGKGIKRTIKGKGIYKNKILDDTDFNEGIREGQKFVPFGRYYINKHHLNDNIISIRRNNGGNVVGFKNARVSNNLGNVFRSIVGTGKTNYTELERLNDDEKKYLHKISKHSNILTRLDIPTPNKDTDEMEMNKFEIMKGEILSGNDNKDYIKNFKLHIVKLMKKDLLPKDQALDILSDLATLGY